VTDGQRRVGTIRAAKGGEWVEEGRIILALRVIVEPAGAAALAALGSRDETAMRPL
jgi:hypothetical protein